MATIPADAFGLSTPHLDALKFTGEFGDLFGQSEQADAARKFFSQPGVNDPISAFTGDLNSLSPDIQDLIKENKPDCSNLKPVSVTTGQSVITADPCKDSFMDKTESALTNLFDKITKIDGAPFNIAQEMKQVTGMIGNASKKFVGQIAGTLSEVLAKWINQGLKAIQRIPGTILPYPAKLAAQTSLVGPVGSLFDSFDCLAQKVTEALMGVIEDMLVGAVQNMLNVPVCAVEEFVGGIVNKAADFIDSAVSPLVNPISSILSAIPGLSFVTSFDVRDAVFSGLDTVSKAANLLKCNEGNSCPGTSKYQIDQGGAKDKSKEEQQSLIDSALAGGSLVKGAGNLIGDFEQAYGKWNIFGSSVGDAPGMPPCDTGNPLKCGSPTVEFFGGAGGKGAAGKAMLGKFINKLDKDNIFGGVVQTASIVGVEITDPGGGYTEAPFVQFRDSCNEGYGAYGKAIIDQDISSPTYGQVTGVTVVTDGAGYPAADYTPEDLYIDSVVIEQPGDGYDPNDLFEDPNLTPIISEGRIIDVQVNQVPYRRLPKLNIKTSSGIGAFVRPIMATKRRQPTEVVQVIDCYSH